MSTRVHELAKELGLKSAELLDRIQQWGLDVKKSTLASLEPDTVEQIKQLHQGPAKAKGPPGNATPPSPATPPNPTRSPTPPPTPPTAAAKPSNPPETMPIAPQAPSAPARRPAPAPPETASSAAPPAAPAPAPAATPAPAPRPVSAEAPTPRPDAAGPPAPRPAPPSAMTGPPRPGSPSSGSARPSASPAPASGAMTRPPLGGGAPPASGRSGPLSGHRGVGGGGAPLNRSGGPLSGHAPGRPGPSGPGGPRGGYEGGGQAEPRPNPSSPPPLRPSDYISPTGTRVAPPSRPPMPTGGPPPVRRSGDGPRPGMAPRPPLGGGGRPLPPVAPPTNIAPPPRRADGPRPTGPEGRSQRPDVKLTPDQIRAMMQSGQIGGAGVATPSRPGSGPAMPGRPAGPGGAPPLRRPPLGSSPGATGLAPPPPPMTDEEGDRKGGPGRLGTAAERNSRRARRNERASERKTISSPLPAQALIEGSDDDGRRSRGPRRGQKRHAAVIAPRKSHVTAESPLTVRGLCEAIGVPAKDVLRKLFNSGQITININSNLEDEAAQMLALEFGVMLELVHERTAEDDLDDAYAAHEEDETGLVPRPPVITILGHVDHGKTSLLDKIRKANVVATESGGITQHIGAYQVVHEGKKLTFVDTPGHEAFTAMRARGANVTDIVVLVVAADDGLMPQTQEAIAHAKAAEVPVVVALNKIDLPGVDNTTNLNKIYGELSQQGLIPEEYGGDTPVIKTSTFTGQGISDLLANLDALAELHELKANPDRPASGTCLEASKSEGRGVVATVLVQDGTLKVGDVIVCGDGFGRVRAMFDDKGNPVLEAPPSTPVEVSGLDEVPGAGERFSVLDDVSRAREIAISRRGRTRGASLGERQAVTLETFFDSLSQSKVKTLNVILKADVQGSLEALTKELEKLENDEVPIRVLHKAVGGITESDVLLADASQAIILGFRVAPEDGAIRLAEEKKIDLRRYDIIYQVTDELKKAVEGMLVPEIKEVHLGRAIVRLTFKISKVGTVAGCFVTQGTIERSAKARVIREGREIYKGGIEALKRFKDDAREVREGFECGIKVTNFDDLKVDDVIEAYRIDVIRRTLEGK